MIKIQIEDSTKLEGAFLLAIEPLVRSRLEALKTAIDHIHGIDIKNKPRFAQFVDVTKELLKITCDFKIVEEHFWKDNYIPTLTNYKKATKKFYPVDFKPINDLLNYLLDPKNTNLADLLVCPPLQLKDLNDKLLTINEKANPREWAIMQLAFNYKKRTNIATALKTFYNKAKLVRFCPYCNQKEAMNAEGHNGKSAKIHHLDHFFDKAANPLLSYSLYNLIPVDGDCNSVNKGSYAFDDVYHLNPYVDGYIEDFSFEPVYTDTEYQVTQVKINLHPANAAREKLLIGDEKNIGDDPKRGNINVFHTLGKYDNDLSWDVSTFTLKKIMFVANQRRNEAKLLVQTGLYDSYENYKEWYETYMETSFEAKEFNKFGSSKLKRDIHDYIYQMKEKDSHNDQIRSHIEKEKAGR